MKGLLGFGLVALLELGMPTSGLAQCDSVNQNEVARKYDIEFGIKGIKQVLDVNGHVVASPRVQKILTDATQDLFAIQYLLCRFEEQHLISGTQEARDCLRRELEFMSTGPKPAEVIVWQQAHPPCTAMGSATAPQKQLDGKRREPSRPPSSEVSHQPAQNQLFSVGGNVGSNYVVGNSMTIVYQGVPTPPQGTPDAGQSDAGIVGPPTSSGFLRIDGNADHITLEGNSYTRRVLPAPKVIQDASSNDSRILREHSQEELNRNILIAVGQDSEHCSAGVERRYGIRVTTGPIGFPARQLAVRIDTDVPIAKPPASRVDLVGGRQSLRQMPEGVLVFGSAGVLGGFVPSEPSVPAFMVGEAVSILLCSEEQFKKVAVNVKHVNLAKEFEDPPPVYLMWLGDVGTLSIRGDVVR